REAVAAVPARRAAEEAVLADISSGQRGVSRVARAVLSAAPQPAFSPRAGDEHAADGVAAPDRRVRATQQVDLGEVARAESGEIEPAAGRGRIGQAHAVEDDQKLLRLRASHPHAGKGARGAVAGESDSGRALEHAGDVVTLDRFDFGLADD